MRPSVSWPTYGEDAKVLAGGQSLIPMMKLRFAITGAPDRRQPDRGPRRHRGARRVRSGSARWSGTTMLAASGRDQPRYPTIAAAAPQIADPIVRNLGTIGGSLGARRPARATWAR